MNPLFFHTAALLVTSVAAVTDARTGRIPNALTIPAAVLGVGLHAPFGATWVGVSLAGCGVAAALPWVLHRSTRGSAIGGGDVKLFAALGALCGPTMSLEVELSSFVLVGVFALVLLAFRGRLLRVLGNVVQMVGAPFLPAKYRRPIEPEALHEMRMGPAIFVAVASVLVRDRLLGWVPWLAG
jgi:prepilin peptidase CpaA